MNEMYPIINLFGYRVGPKVYEFLGRSGKIEISGYSSRKLESILRFMNGQTSVKEIVRRLKQKIPAAEVVGVIEVLSQEGIVTDSRYLFQQFQIDSANPSKFVYNLSNSQIRDLGSREAFSDFGDQVVALPNIGGQVISFLKDRKSERVFSGEAMELGQLSNLLGSMYGALPNRPVPSAGGLYPMALFVQVLAGVNGLQRGLYQYLPKSNSLVFRKSIEDYRFFRIFDSVSLCEKSAVLILVIANINHLTQKYANRGYRYALIETGHICQNAYTSATEQGLGIVEVGGYKDEKLANLLELNYPHTAVFSSLFVGKNTKKRSVSREVDMFMLNDLADKMIQQGIVKSVEVIDLNLESYESNLVAARCLYGVSGQAKNEYSFGTGRTSFEAQFKALVEAYERKACSHLRWDVVERPNNLSQKWLDPRQHFPLRPRQMGEDSVLGRLRDRQSIEWINGVSLGDGEKILIPVEMVFYPWDTAICSRRPTYAADSSGVAAHTNLNEATKNAFFELIERDALMLHWYCDVGAKKIPWEDSPLPIQESIRHLEALGVSVDILDITIDSIPVVLVFIHSDIRKPYCVSGAAAALDYESAIKKSFAEAEFMWLSWQNVRAPKMRERDVLHPKDHGIFYMRKDYKEKLGCILRCKERDSPKDLNLNPEKLFDPIRVIIDDGSNPYGLKVVRVLSSSLLPINFGFGTECWNHQRVQSLGLRWKRKFPSQPHFFA